MATDRIRVTLSFLPSELEVYRRLAAFQGVKVQTVLHEMLQVSYPAAQASIRLVDQLEGVTDEQRQKVIAAADEADANLGSMMALMMGQIGLFNDEVADAIQSPRPSNTGATFTDQVQIPFPSTPPNPSSSLLDHPLFTPPLDASDATSKPFPDLSSPHFEKLRKGVA